MSPLLPRLHPQPIPSEELLSTFLEDRSYGGKSPQFMFKKAFISFSYLKDNFVDCIAVGWQFLSFSILNISFHFILVCRVSAEKSDDI